MWKQGITTQVLHPLRRGFTIVELLIVIVVIAILAAITLVSYNGITQRAADSVVQADVENFAKFVAQKYILSDVDDYASIQGDWVNKRTQSKYSAGYNYSIYYYKYSTANTQAPYVMVVKAKSGKCFDYYTGGKVEEYIGTCDNTASSLDTAAWDVLRNKSGLYPNSIPANWLGVQGG